MKKIALFVLLCVLCVSLTGCAKLRAALPLLLRLIPNRISADALPAPSESPEPQKERATPAPRRPGTHGRHATHPPRNHPATQTPDAGQSTTPAPVQTATAEPTAAPVSTPAVTAGPTETLAPSAPPRPSDIPVPSDTPIPPVTPGPTNTPAPTATATARPTDTPAPTATATARPTDPPEPTEKLNEPEPIYMPIAP